MAAQLMNTELATPLNRRHPPEASGQQCPHADRGVRLPRLPLHDPLNEHPLLRLPVTTLHKADLRRGGYQHFFLLPLPPTTNSSTDDLRRGHHKHPAIFPVPPLSHYILLGY